MEHPNGPESYTLMQYAGVFGLSIWGGLVNFWQNMKSGRRFSIMELVGEISTSGFAGIVTFYLCEAAGLNDLFTAATVGIAGHMGGRTIALIERLLSMRMDSLIRSKLFTDFDKETKEDPDKQKGS